MQYVVLPLPDRQMANRSCDTSAIGKVRVVQRPRKLNHGILEDVNVERSQCSVSPDGKKFATPTRRKEPERIAAMVVASAAEEKSAELLGMFVRFHHAVYPLREVNTMK